MRLANRRSLLLGSLAAGTAALGRANAAPVARLPFDNGERPLVTYPQKRPLLGLTSRPPQLETPFAVFDEAVLTPNDAFFVRYHLADAPPTDLDPARFRLTVQGHVQRAQTFELSQLKRMPATEIVAVNQCSGNGRGFSQPRVGGGQAGNGLMGNARWRGVSLRHVLDLAGVKGGAVQVRFDGLDGPVNPATPDYAKALDIDHARDGEVMLAWSMNGSPLPLLNGYPLRLVVPGHYGTYWVKHLSQITVLDHVLDNYWMTTAYRIPDNDCACVPPGTRPDKTRPIGRLNVRSFITSPQDGAKVRTGRPLTLRGIAFDGGAGIAEVELSPDGGQTWRSATLGPDLGPYSYRPWTAAISLEPGRHRLLVRARSRSGETQPDVSWWNPAAYMRNGIEAITVEAA